ncbi:MAG: porin [Campylobacterales bacterium]
MKFTKLSLAALVAMGIASSASAVENVKVDGHIKLWYQTTDTTKGSLAADTDTTKNDGLFKQKGASGDLVAKLRATGDLTKKVGFGTTFYAMTSGGLENNLVAAESSQGTTAGTEKNPYWLGEAYFTYKAGKTIAKIGRQELDTPLAFTETWNAAPNTFEAAVLLNQDLPDTTLVAAYVSRGNGTTDILDNNGDVNTASLATLNSTLGDTNGATIAANASFSTIGTNVVAKPKGAWAVGAVTTLIPMTTAQVWYYDIQSAAKAYWLQADAKLPMGIGAGLQYAYLTAAGKVEKFIKDSNLDETTNAYAAQLTYSVAGVNLAGAYSSVSEGTLAAANVGTAGTKTKLYTASILADGRLAALPAVDSWKLSANTKLAGFDLGASYGNYKAKKNTKGLMFNRTSAQEFTSNEIDVYAGTKIDDVNLMLYYINQSDYNSDKQDRQAIRAIASINF